MLSKKANNLSEQFILSCVVQFGDPQCFAKCARTTASGGTWTTCTVAAPDRIRPILQVTLFEKAGIRFHTGTTRMWKRADRDLQTWKISDRKLGVREGREDFGHPFGFRRLYCYPASQPDSRKRRECGKQCRGCRTQKVFGKSSSSVPDFVAHSLKTVPPPPLLFPPPSSPTTCRKPLRGIWKAAQRVDG